MPWFNTQAFYTPFVLSEVLTTHDHRMFQVCNLEQLCRLTLARVSVCASYLHSTAKWDEI